MVLRATVAILIGVVSAGGLAVWWANRAWPSPIQQSVRQGDIALPTTEFQFDGWKWQVAGGWAGEAGWAWRPNVFMAPLADDPGGLEPPDRVVAFMMANLELAEQYDCSIEASQHGWPWRFVQRHSIMTITPGSEVQPRTTYTTRSNGRLVGSVWLPDSIAIWPALGSGGVHAAVMFALLSIAARLRSLGRELRGRCPGCGYDLRSVQHQVCPECGQASAEPFPSCHVPLSPAPNPHEKIPKAPESQQDRPPDQPTGEKRGGRG